jgi:two-component system KDP operon response regulator KdpE
VLVVSDLPPHEAKAALTELDADDYLAKPFRASAALERVRALLHPALDSRWSGPAIDIGDLRIDRLGRCAFRDGRQIDLTPTEFNLLTYLAQNADHATSSKKILQAVWGPDYGDTQTLRVHVANLRKKIEPDPAAPRYILTEPGLGYCLASANLKGGKGDRS